MAAPRRLALLTLLSCSPSSPNGSLLAGSPAPQPTTSDFYPILRSSPLYCSSGSQSLRALLLPGLSAYSNRVLLIILQWPLPHSALFHVIPSTFKKTQHTHTRTVLLPTYHPRNSLGIPTSSRGHALFLPCCIPSHLPGRVLP